MKSLSNLESPKTQSKAVMMRNNYVVSSNLYPSESSFEIPEGQVKMERRDSGETCLLLEARDGATLLRAFLSNKEAHLSADRLKSGLSLASILWRWNICGFKHYCAGNLAGAA